MKITYKPLTAEYYQDVIALGNHVHGDGYLSQEKILDWASKGISQNINSNFIAIANDKSGEKLIGFRLNFSAESWLIDQWCSPELWQIPANKCCYFKCSTVDEKYRGNGVGRKLLQLSIEAAKQQGAQAGVAHLWKQSPNNSAIGYFSRCGGWLVKSHPDKWNEESKQGYNCVLCGNDCHCEAAEMIIYFE